jgi:hypothetical protein
MRKYLIYYVANKKGTNAELEGNIIIEIKKGSSLKDITDGIYDRALEYLGYNITQITIKFMIKLD